MTTEQLYQKLNNCLATSNQALRDAADAWEQLRKRGADLSRYPSALHRILPAIAAGTLAPESVIAFASESGKLALVAKLPIAEQKKLAAGGLVDVVRDGAVESRPLIALSLSEAGRVLQGAKIATVKEQRVALSKERKPVAPIVPINSRAPTKQAEISWRQKFRALMRTATKEDREWARKELKIK